MQNLLFWQSTKTTELAALTIAGDRAMLAAQAWDELADALGHAVLVHPASHEQGYGARLRNNQEPPICEGYL